MTQIDPLVVIYFENVAHGCLKSLQWLFSLCFFPVGSDVFISLKAKKLSGTGFRTLLKAKIIYRSLTNRLLPLKESCCLAEGTDYTVCYLLFCKRKNALGQSMLCLRATLMLSFPGVCFPQPALTGSSSENAIKAPLSVTNLIQDKPANPFADYKPMALRPHGAFMHLLEVASPHEPGAFLLGFCKASRDNWDWNGQYINTVDLK